MHFLANSHAIQILQPLHQSNSITLFSIEILDQKPRKNEEHFLT